MMQKNGFWKGMGIGIMAGAALGMTMSNEKSTMKTDVGKRIQQMGTAVDHTLDNFMTKMH